MLTLSHCLAGLALLAGGPYTPEPTTINQRSFQVPFQLGDSQKDRVTMVRLYVSPDHGAHWALAGTAAPTDRDFRFTAERDGIYWFTVQTEDRSGKCEPALSELVHGSPSLVVEVVTKKKPQEVVPDPAESGSELEELEKERDRLKESVRGWEKRLAEVEESKKRKLRQEIEALHEKLEKLKEQTRELEKEQEESRPYVRPSASYKPAVRG
jgi:hypothetical protein